MNKFCETCHSFKKRKCFNADGVCYLVPSKPKFKKKNDKCNFWKERKEIKQCT